MDWIIPLSFRSIPAWMESRVAVGALHDDPVGRGGEQKETIDCGRDGGPFRDKFFFYEIKAESLVGDMRMPQTVVGTTPPLHQLCWDKFTCWIENRC